ncbi:DUF5707 domain-containing protein [Streptomyces albus]|uniref:DUF5707 domain-containing protein n=1 Tax=Streptomyces albus TaxID=1888 RepID=UPI0004CB486D|nr:DUF5707 domain-containing protein [Streptomyces albus]
MSQRILITSLIGAVAIGAVAAGGIALASAPAEPTVENGSARYAAPSGSGAGSFTFTADVTEDSGIDGLKVVVWPASSQLDPTEAEMRHVESADCRNASGGTARCTYTLRITKKDTAGMAEGTWYVSALATAGDGDTTFAPRAATFEVTR